MDDLQRVAGSEHRLGVSRARHDLHVALHRHLAGVEADGAEVTTIEGIAGPDGALSVVQAAFQTHHGLQCGFCTPGMVMTATALLRDNPAPSEEEIREYLEGNICRCTGYHNIVKAIQAAAADLNATRVAAE